MLTSGFGSRIYQLCTELALVTTVHAYRLRLIHVGRPPSRSVRISLMALECSGRRPFWLGLTYVSHPAFCADRLCCLTQLDCRPDKVPIALPNLLCIITDCSWWGAYAHLPSRFVPSLRLFIIPCHNGIKPYSSDMT